MKINYIETESYDEYVPDYKRRIKDKHFEMDPDFEMKYMIDNNLLPYSLEDCILVRTTDAFPYNHEIHTPIYDGVYEFGGSIYFHEVIIDKLKKIYGDSYAEKYEKYKIYSENPRDTLHFTINGLVQSHMQGDFENREFIILEPLKYHIDDSLRSIRPEDTYFKGNMILSSEASIIISEKTFATIKENIKYSKQLESYNIFVYRGNNQTMAVRNTLNFLGYDSFLISNSYYTYASDDYPARQMTAFLNEFCRNNNIFKKKHSLSDDYKDEIEKRRHSAEKIDRMHLKYILDNSDLPDNFRTNVLALSTYYTNYFKNIISELVDKIGLEKFAVLTKQFNEIMIKENQSSKTNKIPKI